MKLRISRVHHPVSVLGPGRRLGIWVQGCTIGCKGCVARDTWSADAGRLVSVTDLVAQCRTLAGDDLDGITISGGEPFEQPEALAALLDALADWQAQVRLDILCYSGLPLARLQREHAAILRRLDALIPGPFVASRPPQAPWMGSANQSLVILSERGRQRYARPNNTAAPAMQVAVADGRVWLIGIPGRGDLERLRARVAQQGLLLGGASWIT